MDRRRFSATLIASAISSATWAAKRGGRPEAGDEDGKDHSDAEDTQGRELGLRVPPAEGVTVQKLNLQRMVYFDTWHASGLYERFQRLVVWEGNDAEVRFNRGNLTQDRSLEAFRPARRYTLLVDGVERATATLAAGDKDGAFKLSLGQMSGGWHTLDIAGLADGETCPKWFAFMLREGVKPEKMPVCTGSYDISKARLASEHAWAWVPTYYHPTPSPLSPAPHPHFSEPVRDLYVQSMSCHINGNVLIPNVDRRGIVNTFGMHSYFYDDFISKYPRVPLLDGPRGVGALSFASHIDIGTATRDADPASPPMLNVYVLDPWRITRLTDSGQITTLAGWRHKGMASYYGDTERGTTKGKPGATLELVGDWSAVPQDRRGFHELWGLAWDRNSLTPDPLAAPIPAEENRRPHVGNPACFVTDSQNNRVCRIQFDGRSHLTPAKVTEFLTGLKDPWDIVTWRGSVIVSERQAHRIAQYDAKTGALQRVVVSGEPLATVVQTTRRVQVRAPLNDVRAQACVAPEGLYVVDDWLYYGSFAQRQVRRVNLVSGEREVVVAELPLGGNSKFVKFCVSDGTFGPKGTVFVQSWANRTPSIGYLPDGTEWKLGLAGFDLSGYGTAVAVRNGRLYFGTSRFGIWRVAKGAPMDAQLFKQGSEEYKAAHYKLLHGTGGYGYYGMPLPWGKSKAIDYYLTQYGHERSSFVKLSSFDATPAASDVDFPKEPTTRGTNSTWFLGAFTPAHARHYDNDGFVYAAAYAVRNKLPPAPRLGVTLHASGGFNAVARAAFAPFEGVDIEVRTQDGQAKKAQDPKAYSEWWCYGRDGQPYPARRVAAILQTMAATYPQIDFDRKGIVYAGNSMGNGGVLHTMILPSPWREKIAYACGGVGVFMPRRVNAKNPGQYRGWPPDSGQTRALWDAIDFSIQAARDAIVRGMHYRQQFSADDWFSEGPEGNTQLEWVNLCEAHKISAVATWVKNGHNASEKGIALPDIKNFEVPEQDVTLDRAHPCFTGSTGNWPLDAAQRVNRNAHPRGHYNIGLVWDHARVVDSGQEIVFPLRYTRRTGLGEGIPDQPAQITVDVTPRRARRFAMRDGERIRWDWDGGAATGAATVSGDVVTATGIPLVSGAGYKRLRFFRTGA